EFVPEVLRTPLYPVVLAGIYRLFGTGQLPVALAQTLMFVAICLLTYGIARRVTSDAVAGAAALVVALFSPIPYFAAMVMTEVWTTVMFTVTMWVAVRCVGARGFAPFAWLGFLAALTTLSRPVFVLLAFALAAVGLVIFPLVRVRERPGVVPWGLTI